MAIEAHHDHALLRRLQAGDETALEALVDRHAPQALALAQRLFGESRLAEDAVIEAFAQLWRTACACVPERTNVEAWLGSMIQRRHAREPRGAAHSPDRARL